MDALFAECLLVQGGFAFLSSKPLYEARGPLSLPEGATRWKQIDDEQRCAEIAEFEKKEQRCAEIAELERKMTLSTFYVSQQKFYQVERTAEMLVETEIEFSDQ